MRFGVARQVVVECHRHAGSSFLLTRAVARRQKGVQRNKVDGFTERLQLRPEHVPRDGRNDLASRQGIHSVVDQHEVVSTQSRERPDGAIDGRRAQRRSAGACSPRHH